MTRKCDKNLTDGTEPVSQSQNTNERLLTKSDVAAYFRVSMRCVERWMQAGAIPFFRVGGAVRFKQSALDLHLNQNCRFPRK
jgi:excisionase family DNA binding protein